MRRARHGPLPGERKGLLRIAEALLALDRDLVRRLTARWAEALDVLTR